MVRKLIPPKEALDEAQARIDVFNQPDRTIEQMSDALEELLDNEDYWIKCFQSGHPNTDPQEIVAWLEDMIDRCIHSYRLSSVTATLKASPDNKIQQRGSRKKI